MTIRHPSPFIPIFDPDTKYGAIVVGNTPTIIPPPEYKSGAATGSINWAGSATGTGTVGSSPVTMLPWEHVYWTDGPNMVALHPTQTGTIMSWPDEVSVSPVALTASAAVNWGTSANFSSKPFIDHSNSATSLTQASVIPSCNSVVVIGRLKSTGTNRWHDTQGTGGGGRWVMGTFSSAWQVFYGANAGQTVGGNTLQHGFVYYQNGSSDYLKIDGTNVYVVADRGTSVMTRLRALGGVELVWIGLYNGDPTLDPGWATFQAWALSYYGITI